MILYFCSLKFQKCQYIDSIPSMIFFILLKIHYLYSLNLLNYITCHPVDISQSEIYASYIIF